MIREMTGRLEEGAIGFHAGNNYINQQSRVVPTRAGRQPGISSEISDANIEQRQRRGLRPDRGGDAPALCGGYFIEVRYCRRTV